MLEAPRLASTPRKKAPAGATDAHFHMFGPPSRYPLSPQRGYTPHPEANLENYKALAATLGLERMVIVHPTTYGTDHACTLDAIEALGRDRAKGIAVVNDSVSMDELRKFDQAGIRGARINAVTRNGTPVSQMQQVTRLIAPLGWHLQLYVEGKHLPELVDTLLALPVDVVIDHMGRVSADKGTDNPEFRALLRLLDSQKCWVKLCGYRSSSGPPYTDMTSQARAIVEAAPERCVWGTDWPHPGMRGAMLPDDGLLLNALYDWVPDDKQQHRILVENPARLYGFAPLNSSGGSN